MVSKNIWNCDVWKTCKFRDCVSESAPFSVELCKTLREMEAEGLIEIKEVKDET